MKTVTFSPKFKKSMKDVRSYKNYKENELKAALDILANGGKLPENMHDHDMAKQSREELRGARVFHLRPNLIVVYKMTDDSIEVLNIGLHNKTKLTSSLKLHY